MYANHYNKAVENLRESVISFQDSPSSYVSSFHQFTHITLVAFYEYVLPSESGIYDANYAALIERKILRETLPHGVDIWKELNSMRNRVEHPLDRKTKSHSKKITVKEIEFLFKQLQVALQEMFNIWLSVKKSESDEVVEATPDTVIDATTETIKVTTTIAN